MIRELTDVLNAITGLWDRVIALFSSRKARKDEIKNEEEERLAEQRNRIDAGDVDLVNDIASRLHISDTEEARGDSNQPLERE